MLSYPLISCEFQFDLVIAGPTLIASDGVGAQPKRFDRSLYSFVRDGTGRIFIPAGSIKGVFRHHAERICRTIESTPIPLSCNPLAEGSRMGYHLGCAQRLEGLSPAQRYRYSCPVCRMFGNRHLAGRLSFSDAYLNHDVTVTEGSLELRGSMAQDRFTGSGYKSAALQLESLNDRTFETKLRIDNFEIWQIGLLHTLFSSIAEGQLRIGRRQSRGMGKITGAIRAVHIQRFDRKGFEGEELNYVVEGIGQLIAAEEKELFGIEKTGILRGVRAFKDSATPKDAPVKHILIRRPTSIAKFLKDATATWYNQQGNAPASGFATNAQTLREQAAALRGKEA